jgi:hypothetical protein
MEGEIIAIFSDCRLIADLYSSAKVQIVLNNIKLKYIHLIATLALIRV